LDFDAIKTNDKADDNFRVCSDETSPARVAQHHKDMRMHHAVDFHRRMEEKHSFENEKFRREMTIDEAFAELECHVDASDPDLELPNKLHLLQTAEGIRRAGHPNWFQLTGLLHDMGEIMSLWGTAEDGQDGRASDETAKQHALGGNTFVVGCAIPNDAVVFPEFNKLNPDMQDKRHNGICGMCEPNCGLDELCLAWGHDEHSKSAA